MGTRVTFIGTPRKCHYMGSDPGTTDLWLPGETRDLSDEVARTLLEDFAGIFEGATPSPAKGQKAKAAPRAIQTPGKRAPDTKKKTTRKRPGK